MKVKPIHKQMSVGDRGEKTGGTILQIHMAGEAKEGKGVRPSRVSGVLPLGWMGDLSDLATGRKCKCN